MSFNKTILMGNLTRDPEIKYTAKGAAISNITIAINEKWKDANGEIKEQPSFIDCVAFGKTAENLAQYFKKGQQILIEGRLKQETWEDKTTQQKRSRIVVTIETWQFAGGKSEQSTQSTPQKPKLDTSEYKQTEDTEVPF